MPNSVEKMKRMNGELNKILEKARGETLRQGVQFFRGTEPGPFPDV